MLKNVCGFCPLHNKEINITVEYVVLRKGNNEFLKASSYKCPKIDTSSSTCSRCPIFYAPTTQAP